MNWTQQIESYLLEGRGVSDAKGDQILQNSERNQAAFQQTLTDAFKTQFANQSGILDKLNGVFSNVIANPQGFSPTMLAALNTNNSEAVSKDFAHAKTAYQENCGCS